MLRLHCHCLLFVVLLLVSSGGVAQHQSRAEHPVSGRLGASFGELLQPGVLGSEIHLLNDLEFASNRKVSMPKFTAAGQVLPWRIFLGSKLPRPLRSKPSMTYVMLDHNNALMRIVTIVELQGCEQEMQWLQKTIEKNTKSKGS